MTADLFAGISVSDIRSGRAWQEGFFGGEPAFLPTDVEAVCEVGVASRPPVREQS